MRRALVGLAGIVIALSGLTSIPASATQRTVELAANKNISMSQVAKNASAKRCWSVIDGSVYDLTTWINRHPGGAQRILGICGKDATRIFAGQHGDTGAPARTLAQFKIGILRK